MGCNTKTNSKSCTPTEEWKHDCVCNSIPGYSEGDCAHICRDGVMDVYKSLVNGNEDEPVKGSRKNPPTWAYRSTCAAYEPNPTVTGPNVTTVYNEVTGEIEYQITPTQDTDTWTTVVPDPNTNTVTLTEPGKPPVTVCASCTVPVTYVFNQTNPVDGDGVIEFTATPSDGGADQFITLPEPTVDTDTNNDWTLSDLSSSGILTYEGTDGQGNPIAMPPVDLNALISPMLIAGTGITLDVDPNTGDITVNSTVVDTTIPDTFMTYSATQTTDPDTGVVTTVETFTPANGGPDVVTTTVSGPDVDTITDFCGATQTLPDVKVITEDNLLSNDLGFTLAGNSASCTPPALTGCAAKAIGTIAFNDEGDTYQWDGTSFVLQTVSADSQRVNATLLGIFTLSDTDLAALPLDVNTDVAFMSYEIENPWCVPAILNGVSRTTAIFNYGEEGLGLDYGLVGDTGNQVSLSGTADSSLDSHGHPDAGVDSVKSEPHILGNSAVIPANSTRVLNLKLRVKRTTAWKPNAGNELELGSTYFRGTLHRGA